MTEFDPNASRDTEARARQALDSAAKNLAARHQPALEQARRTALAQVKPVRSDAWRNGWIGFAVAAGLGMFMLVQTGLPPSSDSLPNQAEHVAALSELTELDGTDYEIIEDLDFAYWLSTQDADVAPEAAHNG
jgi:hypothetical protein